jgi:hypothetical protein
MKKQVGLWIDHSKTVIVSIVNGQEVTQEICSNIGKHVRYSEGMGTGEDVVDRKFDNHLSAFYDEVISLLHDAGSILIFGPGEAKVELKNRLEHDELGGRTITIETADKMTDHQIAAKVREHFKN